MSLPHPDAVVDEIMQGKQLAQDLDYTWYPVNLAIIIPFLYWNVLMFFREAQILEVQPFIL